MQNLVTRLSHSEDTITVVEIENGSCDPHHHTRPFRGDFVTRKLALDHSVGDSA